MLSLIVKTKSTLNFFVVSFLGITLTKFGACGENIGETSISRLLIRIFEVEPRRFAALAVKYSNEFNIISLVCLYLCETIIIGNI